jgi:hypothetical protein
VYGNLDGKMGGKPPPLIFYQFQPVMESIIPLSVELGLIALEACSSSGL